MCMYVFREISYYFRCYQRSCKHHVYTLFDATEVKQILMLTTRADYEFSYFTFDFSDVVERNDVVVEIDDVTFELGDVVKRTTL